MQRPDEFDPETDALPFGPHPLAFVAVLAAVLILGYLATNLFFQRVGAASLQAGPALTEIPEVIGGHQDEATATLEAAGFSVVVQSVPNAGIPPDQVTEQTPEAGSRVEFGSEITIVVSAGDGFVRVPDVRGSPFEELQLLLFTHSLAIGEVVERESEAVAGEVISQTPAPGDTVAAGTEIELVISAGPPMIEIPDVVDMPSAEAARVLRAAGFEVTYQDRYAWRVDRGAVIGTDPEDEAPLGSRITLEVSLGPAPRRPTVTTVPPPSQPAPTPSTMPDGRETYAPFVPTS